MLSKTCLPFWSLQTPEVDSAQSVLGTRQGLLAQRAEAGGGDGSLEKLTVTLSPKESGQ